MHATALYGTSGPCVEPCHVDPQIESKRIGKEAGMSIIPGYVGEVMDDAQVGMLAHQGAASSCHTCFIVEQSLCRQLPNHLRVLAPTLNQIYVLYACRHVKWLMRLAILS